MSGWNETVSVEEEEESVVLPAELETAVSAFLLGATQWRWTTHWTMLTLPTGPVSVPDTVPLGLDYAALRHACAMAKLRLSAEDFAGVRLMEAHALKLLER